MVEVVLFHRVWRCFCKICFFIWCIQNYCINLQGVKGWFLQTPRGCRGLRGEQFEIGSMWPGTSPSYQYWQWYFCCESWQPMCVLPAWWCPWLMLWILWDIIRTQHFGIFDWLWGISSSPRHCDPLTWASMTFYSGTTSGIPFKRNSWKHNQIWYPES
jgi:hypothetical protein